MTERISFDMLIIGAGQAGRPLAHALAKAEALQSALLDLP